MQQPDQQVVDVLGELDALADMAKDGIKKLSVGEAVTGTSALQRIHDRARDAARHARAETSAA